MSYTVNDSQTQTKVHLTYSAQLFHKFSAVQMYQGNSQVFVRLKVFGDNDLSFTPLTAKKPLIGKTVMESLNFTERKYSIPFCIAHLENICSTNYNSNI